MLFEDNIFNLFQLDIDLFSTGLLPKSYFKIGETICLQKELYHV